MDEGFGWLRLSRFEGAPGSPGTSIEARGRFFGSGFTRHSTFFGIRSWGFEFEFLTLSRSSSYCLNHCWKRLRFTPRLDLFASWYVVLYKTGKFAFRDWKCSIWAMRKWGVRLSISEAVMRAGATKELVSIGGCFDLRGLRGGRGRTGFATTVGWRTTGLGILWH